MELDKYKNENVDVWFNDFKHPVYDQKGTDVFIPYLSTLDLFMNVGAKQAKSVIAEGTVIAKNL